LCLFCHQIKSLKTNFKIEGIPANQRGEKLDSDEDESNSQEVEKPNYRYLDRVVDLNMVI